MKRILLMGIVSMLAGGSFAQSRPPSPPPPASAEMVAVPDLPAFDIDFPGGNPHDLLKALNQPLKGTLNVIIPPDGDEVMIPAFKLQGVNVLQVFTALMRVSQRTTYFEFTGPSGVKNYSPIVESFEFSAPSPITAASVWSFRAQKPYRPADSTIYRYFQLGSYLEELKIEDIITAIRTGWNMMGTKTEPALKFHPETKLLVAVGKASDLALIEEALAALPRGSDKGDRAKETAAGGGAKK